MSDTDTGATATLEAPQTTAETPASPQAEAVSAPAPEQSPTPAAPAQPAESLSPELIAYVRDLEQRVSTPRPSAPAAPAAPAPEAFDITAFAKNLDDTIGPGASEAMGPLLKRLQMLESRLAQPKQDEPAGEADQPPQLNFEQRIQVERAAATAHAWFDQKAKEGVADYGADRKTRETNPVYRAACHKLGSFAGGLRQLYQSIGLDLSIEACLDDAQNRISTAAPASKPAPQIRGQMVDRNNRRTPTPSSSGRPLSSVPTTRAELVNSTREILNSHRG